jgi:hypothetical protein
MVDVSVSIALYRIFVVFLCLLLAHRISAVQFEYMLLDRVYDSDILALVTVLVQLDLISDREFQTYIGLHQTILSQERCHSKKIL